MKGYSRHPAQAYEQVGISLGAKSKKNTFPVFFFRVEQQCWGEVLAKDLSEFRGPEKRDKQKGALAAAEDAAQALEEEEGRRERKVVGEQMVGRNVTVVWSETESYVAFVKRWDIVAQKLLLVYYEDDETSWEDLGVQMWEFKEEGWQFDFSSKFATKCQACRRQLPAESENVLQCVACRNAYHPDCLDGQGSQLKGGMWICRQCKPCEVCGLATRPEDMIACESCDDRRHKSCLIPIEDLRTDLTEGAPPEGLQYEGLQYEDKVSLSHCPLSFHTHNHTLTYTHYHL